MSKVSSWLELLGIVKGQDGVAQRGSQVAASLASLDNDLGNLLKGLDHVLGLAHVDKTDRSRNNACGMRLALADKVAQFH